MSMEVGVSRNKKGMFILEIGPVSFELSHEAVSALNNVVTQRMSKSGGTDPAVLQKKLSAYRSLATKLIAIDDRVMQHFATSVSAEQLVTLVRLADGERLFHKVVRNLSRQNAKQFQQDFHDLNKITTHQACLYMEQIVPIIKQAAKEQKSLMNQL